MTRPHVMALLSVTLLDAALLWWGLSLLFIPPLYKLARMSNPFLYYEGHIIVGLAVLLAWFHDWVVDKILWIGEKLHRIVSALLLIGFVGIDAFMHILSIPHLEGWWIPLLGGSACATSVLAWLEKWRKRQ